MLSLPFEICALIISFLRQKDITQVARVCSPLLPVARDLLYQNLRLRSDDPYLSFTLDVLKNDDVSSRIETVQFTSVTLGKPTNGWPGTYLSATWISEELLSSMTRLVELTLIGCPFATSQEQRHFVATIRRYCPLVRTFTYQPLPRTIFPKKSSSFHLEGLEKIVWYIDFAQNLNPQLVSLASASLATLTDLHILKYRQTLPNFSDGLDQWNTLLSSQFPSLTSLTLGYVDTLLDNNGPKMRTEVLTRFLVAHPLLQHLSIGADLEHDQYMEIVHERELVHLDTKDFLPALRSLKTHLSNIAFLARLGVRSLRQITSLAVLYTCGTVPPPLVEIYESSDIFGDFPSVTTLHIQFGGDHVKFVKSARILNKSLARACPAVTSWSSNLRAVFNPTELATFFSHYKHLETVEAPRKMVLPVMNSPSNLDYLGIRCPNLQEIYVPKSNPVSQQNREGVRYILRRHEGKGGPALTGSMHELD